MPSAWKRSMRREHFVGVGDVPEGVRPDGDAAGVVDRLDGLGDGGRLAQAEGGLALDQVAADQRADVVDLLVLRAARRWRARRARPRRGAGGRSVCRRRRAVDLALRRARSRARCSAAAMRSVRCSRSARNSASCSVSGRAGVVDVVAEDVQFARVSGPAPRAPSSTAEISTAGTTRTPCRSPARSASATPLTVSWSVSASSSTPARAARSTTSAASQRAVGVGGVGLQVEAERHFAGAYVTGSARAQERAGCSGACRMPRACRCVHV